MNKRFVALWTIAVFATAAALVVHLSIRFETVRLGYEVSEARVEQRRLVESRRMLMIEAASLRDADRIEAIARTSMQMKVPSASQVIFVDQKTKVRAISGKVR